MKKMLVKILSINPLFSLLLVILYLLFLWYVTASIWSGGHKLGAVAFIFIMSLAVRSQSKGLIDELKRIKAKKPNK